MCIVVYFGYAPPPKTGSARETGSSGMRGSERLGDFFGISVRKAAATEHQAPASACFAAKGRCLESRLAQLGGPALDLRLGDRRPAPGISDRALWSPGVWKLMELRIPLSRKSSRLGPGPRGPSQKGPFPLERGARSLEPGNQRS